MLKTTVCDDSSMMLKTICDDGGGGEITMVHLVMSNKASRDSL